VYIIESLPKESVNTKVMQQDIYTREEREGDESTNKTTNKRAAAGRARFGAQEGGARLLSKRFHKRDNQHQQKQQARTARACAGSKHAPAALPLA
jgi:hypothetical protein